MKKERDYTLLLLLIILLVAVLAGRIEDVSEGNPANFEVLGCFGNISDTTLYFELKDLKTLETITLNIK